MHEKSDVNDNECYIKKHHHSKRYLEIREREREWERGSIRNKWRRNENKRGKNIIFSRLYDLAVVS